MPQGSPGDAPGTPGTLQEPRGCLRDPRDAPGTPGDGSGIPALSLPPCSHSYYFCQSSANSRYDGPIQTCELLKYANPARLGSARIDWLGQGEIRLACPCLRSLLPLLLLLLLPLL